MKFDIKKRYGNRLNFKGEKSDERRTESEVST